MKRLYKNIIAILVAVILCMNINVYDVKAAATVSVSVSASTVSIGQSVTVSVSVSGADISAYTVYISYSSSVLQYTSGSGSASINGGGGTVIMSGTGSGSATLSFTAIANGSASIYTSGELYDINLNAIETSYGGASVTVATADTSGGSSDGGNSGGNSGGSNQPADDRSSNCYIASMEVSPGTLEPEFSYDTYEYSLRVEENVKEITISASPDDSKASIQVDGADEIKPGKNTVEVICTAENGAVKTYVIEVIAGEILEDVIINVGGMDYSIVNFSEDILSVPEAFTKTTVKYDKWDILAYASPNKMIKLVCLQDTVDNQKWFIYNETTAEFTEYKEYSAKYNRYVVMPFPADAVFPEDFVLTQVTIFGTTVDAYQSTDMNDPDKYIIYAMNLDAEEGYYMFDNVEKTFMKYNMPEVATLTDADVATTTDVDTTDEDEGFFTKKNMFYILCGAGGLLLILLICLIGFGVRIGKLNKELEEADIMVAKATKNNLDSIYGADEKVAKKEDKEKASKDAVSEPKSEVEKAIDEKVMEEKTVEEKKTEETVVTEKAESVKEEESEVAEEKEEKPSVSEIPVVNLGMGDVSEYEEQAKEINELISENYDADKDSAFADEE